MKGIINIIEVMLTGIILILAFYHFFPQYLIRPKWDRVFLSVKVRDVLNTIDGLNKTYEFATSTTEFTNFMGRLLKPEFHGALVWWKETKDLEGYTEDMGIPYFTQGYKETIVDVEMHTCEYTVDSNTVALWHFNEGSGNMAYDNTTNGNDGKLYNGTQWNDEEPTWKYGSDCKFGSCLKFDGIDDGVGILNSPSISFGMEDNYTVEAWVKAGIQTGGGGRAIVEKYGGRYPYVIRLNPTALLYFAINNGTLSHQLDAGFIPEPGVWYHIAGVKDGNFLRIYVNGTLVNSEKITLTGEIDNNNDVYIGRRETPADSIPFNGTIDEVRISNVARTNFDVYDVYSFTLGLGYPY